MTDQSTLVASAGVATARFKVLWVFVCFGPESEDDTVALEFPSDSVPGLKVYRNFVNLVKVCFAWNQR